MTQFYFYRNKTAGFVKKLGLFLTFLLISLGAKAQYCVPVLNTYNHVNIVSFTTTGGETNINNTDSGHSDNGYGDFSGTYSASQYSGESLNFTAVNGNSDYGTGFKIWVDWNNDQTFANDASEIAYTGSGGGIEAYSGSFEIPDTVSPGNYRMRIMITGNNSNPDPCQSGYLGEAEDYTLTVLEGDAPSGYCIPHPYLTSLDLGTFIDSFTTSGDISNISNTGSGFGGNGYSNYSNLSVSQYAGEDISFQAIPGTETYPEGLRIWIDENKDGEFSTDEIAYTSPGIINGTHNGSFTVPIIDAGDYRMRVIIMYYSSEIDPCEDGSYWFGEAEDYTLTVLEGDAPSGYCVPEFDTSYGVNIVSFSTTGGETNIDNSGSGYSTGGYGDFSATDSASQYSGENLSFELTKEDHSYNTIVRIWVDWDNDGAFANDGSERVYSASFNYTDSTLSGSFEIPADKAAGDYRMRVMMVANNNDPDPCQGQAPQGWYWLGEAEDYTLTVLENDASEGYCVPEFDTSYGVNIVSFSTTDGETNIDNSGSGYSTGGYGDFSATDSASQYSGENLSFELTKEDHSYNTIVRIWVDWDNDGAFANDGSERVYSASFNYTDSTLSGSFEIPADKAAGDYRMRVMMVANNYDPDPCQGQAPQGWYWLGEAEDYTLTVLEGDEPAPASPYAAVALTGFNADVIAEGSGVPTSSTTNGVDGDAGSGWESVFLNGTYSWNGATPTRYLPANGSFTSDNTAELPYQLAPAEGNNSLRLKTNQSGTLGFVTPAPAQSLYVLATSGSGASVLTATVTFDDATTQQFTDVNVSDWWNAGGYAIKGIGRVERNGQNLQSDPETIRLYEIELALHPGNYGKNITSVSFQRSGGDGSAVAHIMGISIENVSSCPAPVITTTDITFDSATINWTSAGSLFDIEWGTEGFTQGTGTQETGITETSYDLSGLEMGTSYDFYVRQDCGDEQSNWKKFTFSTVGYCIPQPDLISPNYGFYIDSFTTSGGISNISNTGSGFGGNGYSNYSNLSVSQYAGEDISFEAIPGAETYTKGLRIWIDKNKDGEFSTDEIAYTSPGTISGIHNSSFTVPTIDAGDYRMRVIIMYYSSEIDPCQTGYLGEAEDYTLTILPVTSCPAPTEVTATNITLNSATISWTGTGSLFDIEWGAAGFTQGTGTQETGITATSYDLSGLDVGTSYDFYVRQDCGDEQSNWRKHTFYVGYCVPSFNTSLSFYIVSFTTTDGETNIDNTAGYSTGGYGDFSATHSASQYSGETLSFELTKNNYSYNPIVRIWVDWDNDGTFANDESERIYIASFNFGDSTMPGSFQIPADKAAGDYRMRVMMVANNNDPDPCEDGSYWLGEAEDYTLTVLPDLSSNCDSFTIWNGIQWSNGEPDATKRVIIEGDLAVNTDLNACELLLNSGILTVISGKTLTVNGEIINTQNENNFIVENDGNLIQVNDAENEGAITVRRNSTPMMRLDYAMWSSPVDGQGIHAFSPETVASRIYTYEGEDSYQLVPDLESDFIAGKGYMFRAPNNWNVTTDANGGNPVAYPGEFKGVPFNGDIGVSVHPGSYTSVGNPYASNIQLGSIGNAGTDTFLGANSNVGTIYFWTNTYGADGEGGYTGNNWATYTLAGGVSAGMGAQGTTPVAFIAPGQGFIISSTESGTSVSFNNSMRTSEDAVFFKNEEEQTSRFWLNLNGEESGIYNQILVGYMNGATYGIDHQIDGKMFGYEGSAIYNLIDQGKFTIQGRPLPFESSDVVTLGFRAIEDGKYRITLSDYEGLFAEGSIIIYLKDKQLNIIHNLMESAYEFESLAGEFNERFEIVYGDDSTMGTDELASGEIQIYQDKDYIVVDSEKEKILSVELFDLSGRVIHRNEKVNSNLYRIKSVAKGVLIVKAKAQNGEIVTKKVINK